MKWQLRKFDGGWAVIFPSRMGLRGFGFRTWKDAAEYLISETNSADIL